jgi:hypothetical protein
MLRKYPLQPLRTSRMNQFQLRMSQSPLKVGIIKFYFFCMLPEQESEEELESEEDSDDDVNIMIGDIDGQAVININPVSSPLQISPNLYFRKIRQMTVKRRRRLSLHRQL